jgi:hypothetical protein
MVGRSRGVGVAARRPFPIHRYSRFGGQSWRCAGGRTLDEGLGFSSDRGLTGCCSCFSQSSGRVIVIGALDYACAVVRDFWSLRHGTVGSLVKLRFRLSISGLICANMTRTPQEARAIFSPRRHGGHGDARASKPETRRRSARPASRSHGRTRSRTFSRATTSGRPPRGGAIETELKPRQISLAGFLLTLVRFLAAIIGTTARAGGMRISYRRGLRVWLRNRRLLLRHRLTISRRRVIGSRVVGLSER